MDREQPCARSTALHSERAASLLGIAMLFTTPPFSTARSTAPHQPARSAPRREVSSPRAFTSFVMLLVHSDGRPLLRRRTLFFSSSLLRSGSPTAA